MKKGIALTLALLVAMVCVPTTFADTKKADLELQVLSEEYAELMEFHEEVEDLFPEVEITEIPSFEKFCYDSEKPYSKSERPTLIESLETEKNGIVYKLYMYDDDSVGLLSFRDGNLVTGVSDINGGNLRWRWWHASLTWHQVTVTLRVYGSSGNYYFDSPYMPTDVIATNVLPVSLYRGGSNNTMTFLGDPYEVLGTGDFSYYFGLSLVATLNTTSGELTASHSYGSVY